MGEGDQKRRGSVFSLFVYNTTVCGVIILPLIFGIDGIWFSVVAVELTAAVMAVLFIAAKRKKYYY